MSELSSQVFDTLDQLVVRSPYGRLIGAELLEASEGHARVRLPYRLELTATANVKRRGREISTGEVSVQDADGKDVAVALVTYKLSSAG